MSLSFVSLLVSAIVKKCGLATYVLIVCASWLLVSQHVGAVVDIYAFDTQSQRERYHQLVEELRCPKCQNQNLAGSDSQIAEDLRRELHRLLLDGQTDAEIKSFMVDRYGDFVLYNPRFQLSTAVLWGLPIVLLFGGFVTVVLMTRRRSHRQLTSEELSQKECSKLDGLLKGMSDDDRGKAVDEVSS